MRLFWPGCDCVPDAVINGQAYDWVARAQFDGGVRSINWQKSVHLQLAKKKTKKNRTTALQHSWNITHLASLPHSYRHPHRPP